MFTVQHVVSSWAHCRATLHLADKWSRIQSLNFYHFSSSRIQYESQLLRTCCGFDKSGQWTGAKCSCTVYTLDLQQSCWLLCIFLSSNIWLWHHLSCLYTNTDAIHQRWVAMILLKTWLLRNAYRVMRNWKDQLILDCQIQKRFLLRL